MSDISDRILQAARAVHTARWLCAAHDPELRELLSERYAEHMRMPFDEVWDFSPGEANAWDDETLAFVYDQFKTDIETFAREDSA